MPTDKRLNRPDRTANKAVKRKKPLIDESFLATVTPPSTVLRRSAPVARAGFFEGRLEHGMLTVPIALLEPSADQPRKEFDPEKLQELADSFGGGRGILEPIVCRPDHERGVYVIVAGERRYRAAKLAGMIEVPVSARVRTDQECAEDALIENLQREDLSVIEAARALSKAKGSHRGAASDLARAIGWPRQRVANKLRLLNLDERILAVVDVSPRQYSESALLALLLVQDKEGVDAALSRVQGTGRCTIDNGSKTGKPEPFAFSTRMTRAGGVRIAVSARTRDELPDAIAKLREVASTLEASLQD